MPSLPELLEHRAWECRLTPDRALESLEEAEEFLRDRGMLTRTADSALPSLHEACHEEPYAPGSGGFGSWPRTKYVWGFQLAARPGVLSLLVHRGKTLFVSHEVAALLDPICRAELARMEAADPDWARLLRHLDDAGPSLLEDLLVELDLKRPELKRLRHPLERCGAVVHRSLVLSDPEHEHTSELARWDQVFPNAVDRDPEEALADLVVAGVRAAVVAPEREVARWFSWKWRFADALVERLVAEGRLERPERGWVSAAETAS